MDLFIFLGRQTTVDSPDRTEPTLTRCCHGNSPVDTRFGPLSTGPTISLLREEGRPGESWERRKLYSEPRPSVARHHLIGKKKSKRKASPSPIGQHSLRRRGRFTPLVSFNDHQSLCSGQSGARTAPAEPSENKERRLGDQPIR